ncbi:hypothetical protein BIV57_20280 [Mangrovactinospora gilvigrisea]|uniref:Iron transporter n=1 Tax=Mangrovactinospora gilvigrisea TaxID=1428644 RepID=A0A1J7BAQ0_9ACTN|nr:IucA/IucC family protein [Mangrovactinospora gilvigrisea]OIV35694.1 hypothetical protein BIV57_20280 [Mangrovactinospora gilvigrisea]
MHDRTGPSPEASPTHAAVPRPRRAGDAAAPPGPGHDPHDPHDRADAAAAENLLRCWLRESGAGAATDGGRLRVPLPALGPDAELRAPLAYRSAAGHHRLGGPVLLALPGRDEAAVTAAEIAALLAGEAGAVPRNGAGEGEDDLVARVVDSVSRTAAFLAARTPGPGTGPGPGSAAPEGSADPFLDAEQALVLGHPLHPTPKSRQGLDDAELRAYSPELRGSFALHWIAAAPELVAQDSALDRSAAELVAEHAGAGQAAAARAEGLVLVPVHPRQAREAAHRPGTRELFARGLLRDLGAGGPAWHPTSSVRTVYRGGASVMLKLSLSVRITNSRRENLRKELHRGIEVHRLLETGLGAQWQDAHPGFGIVRDPAWLGIGPDAEVGSGAGHGLDVMIRQNPFPVDGVDAACVAGLTAPRPVADGTLRSGLEELVRERAARTGDPVADTAAAWLRRYLDRVVAPVLWLDGEAGIALEAHQQNTVVLLDEDGLPAGGRYRDNQGFYYRESRRAELTGRLPGLSATSDTFVPDPVADERFAYYLGLNNICGLIGALGAQGLAPEAELLGVLRGFLAEAARTGASTLPRLLLDTPRLRCKANLLTRLHGMDELVGPVETQSVYVPIDNPIHAGEPA